MGELTLQRVSMDLAGNVRSVRAPSLGGDLPYGPTIAKLSGEPLCDHPPALTELRRRLMPSPEANMPHLSRPFAWRPR